MICGQTGCPLRRFPLLLNRKRLSGRSIGKTDFPLCPMIAKKSERTEEAQDTLSDRS